MKTYCIARDRRAPPHCLTCDRRDPDAPRSRRPRGHDRRIVKPKKGGAFKLTVQDRADEHDFRLRGPGVNVATSVGGTGTKTFLVKLRPGKTYTFVCDPHADEMRGSFSVRG